MSLFSDVQIEYRSQVFTVFSIDSVTTARDYQ